MKRSMLGRASSILAVLLIFGLVLSGCGNKSSGQPKQLQKVRVLQTTASYNHLSVYLADALGYFKEEGLEADIQVAGSGAAGMASLIGGSTDVLSGAPESAINAMIKGEKLKFAASLTGKLAMDIIVSTKLVEEKKLSTKSTLEEIALALKGKTMAAPSSGAAVDVWTRKLLTTYGLKPEVDTKIVYIPNTSGQLAAMSQGTVDAFIAAAPFPQQGEKNGIGKVLVHMPEKFKGADDFPLGLLITTDAFYQKNKDVLKRTAQALGRANNWAIANPDKAKELMFKKKFSDQDKDIVYASVEAMLPSISPNGMISKTGLQNIANGMGKAVLDKIDLNEGVIWTNEFVKDLKGKK